MGELAIGDRQGNVIRAVDIAWQKLSFFAADSTVKREFFSCVLTEQLVSTRAQFLGIALGDNAAPLAGC